MRLPASPSNRVRWWKGDFAAEQSATVQLDSQVKVDGLETFRACLLGLWEVRSRAWTTASSISGNILYRPAANLLIVVEDETKLLSNDDFGNLFVARKSIAAENPNTWCKLAGAVTRMAMLAAPWR